MWDKVIKKTVDTKVKSTLQPLSGTRKINSRYPKGYKSLVKKNKENDSNQEPQNGNKDKTKSHNPFSTNSQPQIQAFKKNKRHRNRRGGQLATKINTTKMAKKDKDKVENLSYIECYTCKQ